MKKELIQYDVLQNAYFEALIILIYLIHNYFILLLVNDECKISEGGNVATLYKIGQVHFHCK